MGAFKSLELSILELKEKIAALQKEILEMSVPVIPAVVPGTIIVPLLGRLSVERLHGIQAKVAEIAAEENVEAVIVDFTGIYIADVEASIGYEQLGREVVDLAKTLELIGVDMYFAGLSPKFVQMLVLSDAEPFTTIKAFATNRHAIKYVLKRKGFQLVKQT